MSEVKGWFLEVSCGLRMVRSSGAVLASALWEDR
jgi:hypothetical protein